MAKSKAKETTNVTMTGELTIGAIPDGLLTLTEVLDDQINTFDVIHEMRKRGLEGQQITLTFKGEVPLEPMDEE